MFNAIFKWLVSYILDSSIYLNGTVTNMKASASLVTVHISTNLYIIFTFHHLLTYWFSKSSFTVST